MFARRCLTHIATRRLSLPRATIFQRRLFATDTETQKFDYSKTNEGGDQNIVWSEGLFTTEERIEWTGQRGATLWLTGLSGSGKSTVGCALEARLLKDFKVHAYRLDGDNVRFGLNKDLGFTDKDRDENIRRIGEVAKLFSDSGSIAITAFISPFREARDSVRQMHEDAGLPFYEILTEVPLEEAERRDPKGLYKKARAGLIPHFTGIDSPYETPLKPELVVETMTKGVEECVDQIVAYLLAEGILKPKA
jgi:adenylylsulfate kinase